MTQALIQSIVVSAKILKRNYGEVLYPVANAETVTVTTREVCYWSITGGLKARVDMLTDEVELFSCTVGEFDTVLDVKVTSLLTNHDRA